MRVSDLMYELDFNAPYSEGKPYPKRNPKMINEEDFPHGLRAKSLDVEPDYDATGEVWNLKWISEEGFDKADFEIFVSEVQRCIQYLCELKDVKEPFIVNVHAVCRDGQEWGEGEKQLTFNDGQKPIEVEDEPVIETEEVVELHESSSTDYNNELLPEELRPYFNLRTELDREYKEDELASELEDEVGVKVVGVLEMKDDFFDEVDGAEIDGDFWCDDGRAYFGIAEYPSVYRWFDKSVEELLEPFKYVDVTYWIEYGDDPRNLSKTVRMSLEEITPLFNQYIEAYPIAEIHSSDDDESANYNF